MVFIPLYPNAQVKKWSNNSGTGIWTTAANWIPSGVPVSTDDVILDNTYVSGSYVLDLPQGITTIRSLGISPLQGQMIRLRLPSTNTNQPGFSITATSGDVLKIDSGGIFENSSGVSSSPSILIPATVRINNGGRYIHNNISTASAIVNNLSLVAGTELGIMEYAQGASNSLLSSGVTYNSLELSTTSNKTFNFSGNNSTIIRGNMIINNGVTLNALKNGNILVSGDLNLNGSFDFSPPSGGITERSLIFSGTNQYFTGNGNFTQGNNFRNVKVNTGSTLTLLRNVTLTNAVDSFIVDTAAILRMGNFILYGGGKFILFPRSTLSIGSQYGINNIGNNTGNIQTLGSRTFDSLSSYEYTGIGIQNTGNGLPGSVKKLIINKQDLSSCILTKNVQVNDTMSLQKGFLVSTHNAILQMTDTTKIASPESALNLLFTLPSIGHEKSFINGPVAWKINSTTAKWFPVGKVSGSDTLFAPVKLSKFNSTPVIDTVEYFHSSPTDENNVEYPPLDHISKLEYWSIHGSTTGSNNSDTVTLSWRTQSRVGNGIPVDWPTALNDLTISHYFDDDGNGPDPLRWNIEGSAPAFNTNGNTNNGLITGVIPVDLSSDFTLATKSPYNILPLNLRSFYATIQQPFIEIAWTTKDELNIAEYVIEKSLDGSNFHDIGSLPSEQSATVHNYIYYDPDPGNRWVYYRLKIRDLFSRVYLSSIIHIWSPKKGHILLYPNPAKNEIFISRADTSSIFHVEIVNSVGQIIINKIMTHPIERINIEYLRKGIYGIRFHSLPSTETQVFLKQ